MNKPLRALQVAAQLRGSRSRRCCSHQAKCHIQVLNTPVVAASAFRRAHSLASAQNSRMLETSCTSVCKGGLGAAPPAAIGAGRGSSSCGMSLGYMGDLSAFTENASGEGEGYLRSCAP